MRPAGAKVAQNAISKIGKIAYDEQDCQRFVENCVRDCGGKMSYAGSNDMFRNACVPKPLEGLPPLGALLFILKKDGGEPEKYKADNKGNASHVGLYCGVPEAVHSSQSKGGVVSGALKGGWTHYGLAKEIAYEGGEEVEPYETEVIVSSVNLRKAPSKQAELIGRIERGEKLIVLSPQGEWAQVDYKGQTGYLMLEFVGTRSPQKVTVELDYAVAAALFDALGEVM
jgi:SH3 domain protein